MQVRLQPGGVGFFRSHLTDPLFALSRLEWCICLCARSDGRVLSHPGWARSVKWKAAHHHSKKDQLRKLMMEALV